MRVVINDVSSRVGGPAYVSFDRRVNTGFVTNFGGGEVPAIPVRKDGTLLPTEFGSDQHRHRAACEAAQFARAFSFYSR